jgi:prolyl 4-hydroxylase
MGSTERIERKLISLNERLRFLRYAPGQKFERHYDGWYSRKNGERSFITFQLYLNEDFSGGETTFFLDDEGLNKLPVVPKTGSVLLFQHDIMHEGSKLVKGTKYVIRSDIMYTGKMLF